MVVAPPITFRGPVNLSNTPVVSSSTEDHDPLDKAQLHESINAVATLPYPNLTTYSNSTVQRLSRDLMVCKIDKDTHSNIQTLDKDR
jgi:hypothetical protein